jgi:hypothetical protein
MVKEAKSVFFFQSRSDLDCRSDLIPGWKVFTVIDGDGSLAMLNWLETADFCPLSSPPPKHWGYLSFCIRPRGTTQRLKRELILSIFNRRFFCVIFSRFSARLWSFFYSMSILAIVFVSCVFYKWKYFIKRHLIPVQGHYLQFSGTGIPKTFNFTLSGLYNYIFKMLSRVRCLWTRYYITVGF